MSEFINNSDIRRENLLLFSIHLIEGKSGIQLIEEHKNDIKRIKPIDVIWIVDQLVTKGYSTELIKKNINKILNVFHEPIARFKWEHPEKDSFLDLLMQENKALIQRLNYLKTIIKEWNKTIEGSEKYLKIKEKLRKYFLELRDFNLHYIKKENILFPYLEKRWKDYRCLGIMWSFHDDIRDSLKCLLNLFDRVDSTLKEFNNEIGRLYLLMFAIQFREDQLIFPVAYSTLKDEDWLDMLDQAFDTGFVFIKPEKKQIVKKTNPADSVRSGFDIFSNDFTVDLGTGKLTADQLILVLENLPIDITLIDENDEVKYFNNTVSRIFPRSKAIIGRKVQNCHPPESVHVVNQLLKDFRNNTKNKENFWIKMKGKFIFIEYIALRDTGGNYRGTLEVNREISDILKLEGEKRLMN